MLEPVISIEEAALILQKPIRTVYFMATNPEDERIRAIKPMGRVWVLANSPQEKEEDSWA